MPRQARPERSATGNNCFSFPPPITPKCPDGIEHQNSPGDCDFKHSKVALSPRLTLTGPPSRVWIMTFDVRHEGLHASTGSTCRHDCCRKRSGTTIARLYS